MLDRLTPAASEVDVLINTGADGEWEALDSVDSRQTKERKIRITTEEGAVFDFALDLHPNTTLEQLARTIEVVAQSKLRAFHVGQQEVSLAHLPLVEYLHQRLSQVAPGLSPRAILDNQNLRLSENTRPFAQGTGFAPSNELIMFQDISIVRFVNGALPPAKTAYQMGAKLAEYLREKSPGVSTALELGTGSGVASIKLAKELGARVQITATDLRSECLASAEISREVNGLRPENLRLKQGDWYNAVPFGKYDLIFTNPPFLPHFLAQERHQMTPDTNHLLSLDGGELGMDYYRCTLEGHAQHLKPGGSFAFQVQPRACSVIRQMALEILGRRYKDSMVYSENKIKRQAGARGFMVVIETQ
jgi:methylase of polypeptide subunit release factors